MKIFGVFLVLMAWSLACVGVYLTFGLGPAFITGGAGLWLELNLPYLIKAKT